MTSGRLDHKAMLLVEKHIHHNLRVLDELELEFAIMANPLLLKRQFEYFSSLHALKVCKFFFFHNLENFIQSYKAAIWTLKVAFE
jgi:hypothetical protein